MRNIIFLDIDGVLNCQQAFKEGNCKYIDWKCGFGHHMSFYHPSKQLLNNLIKETNADIVISSTWRKSGIKWLNMVWEEEKMEGKIIGITPSLHFNPNISIPRGMEIQYWLNQEGFRHINWSENEQLKYMKESNISNYIIIDDDSDMLYQQRNHFIHVLPSPRNPSGFNQMFYQEALNTLNQDIIKLNYET